MTPPSPEAIRAALLALAAERRAGATFCPSEVARRLAEDWRPLMDAVRTEAAALQAEGRLVATRRGAPVAADAPGGPIRLRRG